jgi:hypothetical protein
LPVETVAVPCPLLEIWICSSKLLRRGQSPARGFHRNCRKVRKDYGERQLIENSPTIEGAHSTNIRDRRGHRDSLHRLPLEPRRAKGFIRRNFHSIHSIEFTAGSQPCVLFCPLRIWRNEGISKMSLESITQQVKAEISKLTQALQLLEGAGARQAKARPHGARPIRMVSAASRHKMAQAQRARWAKVRGRAASTSVGNKPGAAPVKRTMSASARRKIAAAQRARWAKVKAAKKAA